MAHVKKFTRDTASRMFLHYERGKGLDGNFVSFGRSAVDPSRMHLNYRLDDGKPAHEKFEKRLSEVPHQNRQDLKALCAWVVTLPTDGSVSPEEERSFFEAVKEHLDSLYGKDNCICAVVHKDETTPHMHYAFVPVSFNKKKGKPNISAKQVLTKAHLQKFHDDLQNSVSKALGHRVGILLGDEDPKKTIKSVSIDELKARDAKVKNLVQGVSMALTAKGSREKFIERNEELLRRAMAFDVANDARKEAERKAKELEKKNRELQEALQSERERYQLVEDIALRPKQVYERYEREKKELEKLLEDAKKQINKLEASIERFKDGFERLARRVPKIVREVVWELSEHLWMDSKERDRLEAEKHVKVILGAPIEPQRVQEIARKEPEKPKGLERKLEIPRETPKEKAESIPVKTPTIQQNKLQQQKEESDFEKFIEQEYADYLAEEEIYDSVDNLLKARLGTDLANELRSRPVREIEDDEPKQTITRPRGRGR